MSMFLATERAPDPVAYPAKATSVCPMDCAIIHHHHTSIAVHAPTKPGRVALARNIAIKVRSHLRQLALAALNQHTNLLWIAEGKSDWEQLVNCGGTKYCCAADSDCCTKSNLVFDIGVPSVINNYGSSVSYSTLSGGATTWQSSLITAAATATAGGASGTGGSSNATAKPASSSHGVVIGVVAGVVVFLALVVIGAVVFCCLRKRSPPAKPAQQNYTNMIDMQDRSAQAGAATTGVVQPGTGQTQNAQNPFTEAKYVQAYGQQTQGPWQQPPMQWQNAPPTYQPPQGNLQPYQVTPMSGDGQSLVELQSPIARPVGQDGKHFHELG
jgi:hypothetical protein